MISVSKIASGTTTPRTALMREYRTRLVADVVTGKLDVRPAARHLPAEPEPPALPEEPSGVEEAEASLETEAEA
jgi:type I restriction enzyme S subunit